MRSAERGKKIVQRHLVGQVDGREPQAPLVTVAMEEVVIANAGIEQVARVDARRIVIVILGTWCRYLGRSTPYRDGSHVPSGALSVEVSAAAEEPGLYLLVCGESCEIHRRRGVPRKGNSPSHETASYANWKATHGPRFHGWYCACVVC